jgi:hypothetical protein
MMRSVPVRRTLGQQPVVIGARTLAPARVRVVAGLRRQRGSVVVELHHTVIGREINGCQVVTYHAEQRTHCG